MKIDERIAAYLDGLRARALSPASVRCAVHALARLAGWLAAAPLDLRCVSSSDIEHYAATLRATRSARPPHDLLSPATIIHELTTVRLFFAWLARERQLLIDPAADLHLGKLRRTLPANVMSESETRQLLDGSRATAPWSLRDRALLELLYSSGLRRAEVASLDLSDVDFDRGVIIVRRGKGGEGRVVPLGETAARALRDYIAHERVVFAKSAAVTALFIATGGLHPGTRMTPAGIAWRVHEAAARAGMNKRVTTHTLRHSVATHLLRAGVGLRHVQALLGHTNISSTQIYTHVTIADLADAHAKAHPRGGAKKR